jgi:hypothetical protein
MEAIFLLIAIAALIVAYFFIGMLLKFIVGWLPALLSMPIGIFLMIQGGWALSVLGIIILIGGILYTSEWEDSKACCFVVTKLDKLFYFRD